MITKRHHTNIKDRTNKSISHIRSRDHSELEYEIDFKTEEPKNIRTKTERIIKPKRYYDMIYD